jgi:3-methyladenine DNA glycosylase AlkD
MPSAGGERAPRAPEVLAELRRLADPSRLPGMARYGIATEHALGVTMTELRGYARPLGRDHELAGALWGTGIHEARLLATLVDEPAEVTEAQMDRWVRDVDSWDLCDGLCGNLFDRTPFALDKSVEWSAREEEFVRRAAFALIAWMTVHRKDMDDERFEALLPLVIEASTDDRNYVKKAVNWALRQIGKRSRRLNHVAIEAAREIQGIDSRAARWIASDALRELTSEAVQQRLDRARRGRDATGPGGAREAD